MTLFDNSADFCDDFAVGETHNQGGNDQDNDQEIKFLQKMSKNLVFVQK